MSLPCPVESSSGRSQQVCCTCPALSGPLRCRSASTCSFAGTCCDLLIEQKIPHMARLRSSVCSQTIVYVTYVGEGGSRTFEVCESESRSQMQPWHVLDRHPASWLPGCRRGELLHETRLEKYTSDRSSRQPHGTTYSGQTAGNGMPTTATTINAHFLR